MQRVVQRPVVGVVVEQALEVVVVGGDRVVVDARRRVVGVRAGSAEGERLWEVRLEKAVREGNLRGGSSRPFARPRI